jgi:hypothetical protein
MTYVEVTVVVDGAVDEHELIFDYAVLAEYIAQVERDARGHGYPTEVHLLWHHHTPQADCCCVQYEPDHRPAHQWHTR